MNARMCLAPARDRAPGWLASRGLASLLAACGGGAAAADAALDGGAAIDAAPGCGCTLGAPALTGTITLAAADELSGLAVSRARPGVIWTHDDGAATDLFAFSLDGTSRGALHLAGADTIDLEDLAIAPCGASWCLYAGDLGDNDLTRTSVAVYEVVEPATTIGTVDVTWRRFEIAYPDGPHDAEALIVDPRDGGFYAITKVQGGASAIYRLPRVASGIATAERVGSFTPPSGDARVTAADLAIDSCGARLLIRTHDRLFELAGAEGVTIAGLFQAAPVRVPVADEDQGEAVGFDVDGRGYVTTGEGIAPALSAVSCAP
ncbi:MAG: hypothetical protein K8W52_01805 [Deltaproteobacteria bacterium]|nr:hypothetical protein [Deltaproteobacteria bacterium]